ncbi:MAG TPA: dTMP kinase [Verrucomicrobiae bacterium]|jgi:dTMP kinase|nr:dTMP kinase [Verrucomicrobiae bacterium]
MTSNAGGRGRFITFEGGEGGGKSTQTKLLLPWLSERGVHAVATREPGGSPGAERIRELLVTGDTGRWTPNTEVLLHYAARHDHIQRNIEPALAAGRWVVCDRFFDSTLAYQGYGHGVALDFIETLRNAVVGDRYRPDLTLILDLPAAEGLKRSQSRVNTERRYESMPVEFHERLREGFQAIARQEPERCRTIDALQSIESVQRQIRAAISKHFELTA